MMSKNNGSSRAYRIFSIVVLIILGIVLFFLLRSWTVYDEAGAHVRFPWSQAAE